MGMWILRFVPARVVFVFLLAWSVGLFRAWGIVLNTRADGHRFE